MLEMTKEERSEKIARNVAAIVEAETKECFVLNLGVGIPTLVADYIQNKNVFIQAENGMLGVGKLAHGDQIHPQLINAGRQPVLETEGCVYMDSSESFGMIRGGHVDATVLGAFEVDEQANVANWIVPGGKQLGVGGAMDLVCGAKEVIIAMLHTNKGKPKLVKRCTLPVTGYHEVDWVITEYGVFRFRNGKVRLSMISDGIDLEELKSITELEFEPDESVAIMV